MSRGEALAMGSSKAQLTTYLDKENSAKKKKNREGRETKLIRCIL